LLDDRNNVTEHQCYLSKRHVPNDGIAQLLISTTVSVTTARPCPSSLFQI